jgi:hypothetical protein
MARWVLPVPIGPAKIRLSGAVTHSPRASVWTCRVYAVGGREVEGVECLHLGESGVAEPLADHGLVARRLLGAEDLVEIVFMRPMRIAGLPGQRLKGARHAGQLEGARVGDHQIADDRRGAHAPTATSQSS